ncbi:MAG: hypothetical protein ACRBB4_15720 [Neptuniibacter sp.]
MGNKVKHYRETVIGWNKRELAEKAATTDKTVTAVENNNKGGTATRTRILNAINLGLKELGNSPIDREELYSPFGSEK